MRKKIAIIFRGPIRPDTETVLHNVRLLKSNFSDYSVDTYLMTWNNQESLDFVTYGEIDNLIMIKEPSKEFIGEILTSRTKQNSLFDRNYKAFWSVINSIKIVLNTQIDYDWIVLTRTDLSISITNIDEWLDESAYVMPTQENYIINDQFGIAKPNIMLTAWDYRDIPTLNRLYGESFNPEDCLRKIMDMNDVKTRKKEADHYILNPKRHASDKDYLRSSVVKIKKRTDRISKIKLFIDSYFPKKVYTITRIIYKKWKK